MSTRTFLVLILPPAQRAGRIFRLCRPRLQHNRNVLPKPKRAGRIFQFCRIEVPQKRNILPGMAEYSGFAVRDYSKIGISCRIPKRTGRIFRLCRTPHQQNRKTCHDIWRGTPHGARHANPQSPETPMGKAHSFRPFIIDISYMDSNRS